ncbi:unnamed protein product [Durusdinium trenchii]|uniref:Uncharacterized protein n=1 Tax=Durusdinium trenchii TaxID=1381693 RepID=A0ABP0JVH5_9DINO
MVDVLQATVQEILNEISRLEKGQAAGTEDYVQLLSDVERKAPLLGRRTVPLELLKHLDEGGSLESWCRDQAKRYVETLKEKQERGKPLKCLTRCGSWWRLGPNHLGLIPGHTQPSNW